MFVEILAIVWGVLVTICLLACISKIEELDKRK